MTEPNNDAEVQVGQVGYAKPPKHTRFKPGQSGNLKGRPKGTLNMATVLERTLRAKVVVNENGRRRTITKLEAAIQQLTNKAASGELKALQLLAGLVRSAEERTAQTVIPTATLDEADEKVMVGILKRMESTQKENQENGNESDTQ
jgi:hypothetical protein